MEARQERRPSGVAERGEGFPRLEGPSGPWIRVEEAQCFSCPIGWGSLPSEVLRPQWSLSGRVGPGGIGGRPGQNRRGRQEEPSRTRGEGKEQRVFAPSTRAQEACWAPRWVLRPLRPQAGGIPKPLLFC